MQSGCLARLGPRALSGAQRPPAGADEHRVAAADLDVGELFPRFEILRIDRRVGVEPLHALQQRHVDQDRARCETRSHAVDGVFRASLLGGGGMAVVDNDLAVAQQGVMAQRIEMRVGAVVNAVADGVERAARLAGLGRTRETVPHLMLGGSEVEVVDGFLEAREACQRDHGGVLDKRQRLLGFFRRHQVEGAALVVLAPAAPVGQRLFHRHHLFEGHAVGRLLGRGMRRDRCNCGGGGWSLILGRSNTDRACEQRQDGKRKGPGRQYFHPRQLRFHDFLRQRKMPFISSDPTTVIARLDQAI